MEESKVFFKVKSYQELAIDELYELLRLRTAVFVVEQNCAYQDIDGSDNKAHHILGYKGGTLVAYARIFSPGVYFYQASIGRVVVRESQRAHNYGYELMNRSIQAVEELYNTRTIKLSAQSYLKSFYNTLGFKEVGEVYLEDDIPHIKMIKA